LSGEVRNNSWGQDIEDFREKMSNCVWNEKILIFERLKYLEAFNTAPNDVPTGGNTEIILIFKDIFTDELFGYQTFTDSWYNDECEEPWDLGRWSLYKCVPITINSYEEI